MRFKTLPIVIILVLFPIFVQAQGDKNLCDRACLEGYVDKYMAAMLDKLLPILLLLFIIFP